MGSCSSWLIFMIGGFSGYIHCCDGFLAEEGEREVRERRVGQEEEWEKGEGEGQSWAKGFRAED